MTSIGSGNLNIGSSFGLFQDDVFRQVLHHIDAANDVFQREVPDGKTVVVGLDADIFIEQIADPVAILSLGHQHSDPVKPHEQPDFFRGEWRVVNERTNRTTTGLSIARFTTGQVDNGFHNALQSLITVNY